MAVVMGSGLGPYRLADVASMGPRSDGRGYGGSRPSGPTGWNCFNGSTVGWPWLCGHVAERLRAVVVLQWVHGRMAVVMQAADADRADRAGRFNGSTVGWPWLW